MKRSVHRARLIGGMVAAGAVAFIGLLLAGVPQDWLGGWFIRCGGRFTRHECADGEIPWSLVFSAGVVGLVGFLVACGDIAIRRGKGSLQSRLEFRRSASQDPPEVLRQRVTS
jgi:MFS family permease